MTNTFDGLLTKGAHGSSGVFTGFALPTFANFLMAHAMVKNKVFSPTTSYIGLVGNFLRLVYIVLITFYPGMESFALLLAMPGGLLIMLWMILYTLKLNQLRKYE